MLKKDFRITENKDFQIVLKNGRFVHTGNFLLKYIKNTLTNSRFGFIVSTKTFKRAVDRNLVKRRLRETIRLNLGSIKDGYDIVFIIKKPALGVKYGDLEKDVLNALEKSKLIK